MSIQIKFYNRDNRNHYILFIELKVLNLFETNIFDKQIPKKKKFLTFINLI